MSIEEQARAAAAKRWPVGMYHVWDGNLSISSERFGGIARDSFKDGFLAGHEAAKPVADAAYALLNVLLGLPKEALGDCNDHMVTEDGKTFCKMCAVLEDLECALVEYKLGK